MGPHINIPKPPSAQSLQDIKISEGKLSFGVCPFIYSRAKPGTLALGRQRLLYHDTISKGRMLT